MAKDRTRIMMRYRLAIMAILVMCIAAAPATSDELFNPNPPTEGSVNPDYYFQQVVPVGDDTIVGAYLRQTDKRWCFRFYRAVPIVEVVEVDEKDTTFERYITGLPSGDIVSAGQRYGQLEITCLADTKQYEATINKVRMHSGYPANSARMNFNKNLTFDEIKTYLSKNIADRLRESYVRGDIVKGNLRAVVVPSQESRPGYCRGILLYRGMLDVAPPSLPVKEIGSTDDSFPVQAGVRRFSDAALCLGSVDDTPATLQFQVPEMRFLRETLLLVSGLTPIGDCVEKRGADGKGTGVEVCSFERMKDVPASNESETPP